MVSMFLRSRISEEGVVGVSYGLASCFFLSSGGEGGHANPLAGGG